MNKLIVAAAISAPLILIGCTSGGRIVSVDRVVYTPSVDRVVYTPAYNVDSVSVGYYSATPYWGTNYWLYDYSPHAYWGGYYSGY